MYRPDPAPHPDTRVMIVEHEPAVRDALEMMLVLNGYRALGASDGPTALAQLRSTACSLLIVDLARCGMDGESFLREARRLAPAEPPSVVLIADADDVPLPPAEAYLPRPFEWGALLQQVTRLLPRSAR